MFDALAVEDQRAYIQFLVQSAQQIFVEQRRSDLSKRVEELLKRPRRKDQQSPGEEQFDEMLAKSRPWFANQPGHFLHGGEIEGLLTQTFVNNGIAIPRTFHKRFEELLRERPYWPKLPLVSRK